MHRAVKICAAQRTKRVGAMARHAMGTTQKREGVGVDKVGESVKQVAKEAKKARFDLGFSGGDVGAARAGTTSGFSAVHAGRKQLLRMLQEMKAAQQERKKQTAALREISANTAEQITINQAHI